MLSAALLSYRCIKYDVGIKVFEPSLLTVKNSSRFWVCSRAVNEPEPSRAQARISGLGSVGKGRLGAEPSLFGRARLGRAGAEPSTKMIVLI